MERLTHEDLPRQAEAFGDQVNERYPDQVVEVVNGGQPFYAYLISAE